MATERTQPEPELPPSYEESIQDTSGRPSSASPAYTKQVVRSLIDEVNLATAVNASLAKLEAGPSSPPSYARHDPAANVFILRTPFIYTASAVSDTPRYQMQQTLTRSGRPFKLQIRTLAPSESRRLSLQGAIASSAATPSAFIGFDDDLAVYEVQGLGFIGSSRVEIRGCRSRCLPGYVRVDSGLGVGRSCKFWHMTRNEAADRMRPENERRMQKYGYHSRDEWNRNLLFAVEGDRSGIMGSTNARRCEWKDGNGKLIATERDDRLEFASELTVRLREALLSCWLGRAWMGGTLAEALETSGASRSIQSV